MEDQKGLNENGSRLELGMAVRDIFKSRHFSPQKVVKAIVKSIVWRKKIFTAIINSVFFSKNFDKAIVNSFVLPKKFFEAIVKSIIW